VANALETRPSSSFLILTKYDSNGYNVDDSTGFSIIHSATQGSMDPTSTSVTVSNLMVGATTTYKIQFNAIHGLY